ncbi:DUF3592 domain-containing protein [Kangiella geojedonensis]|uniref:DUF3592 domain-containing protein n=1 Tax=Kangiella geojedonensis TaxID=914150 RepID=A0A0F6TRW6_9GAMM|nr:DUF3592 domain-containing protein [Kangiella geojedonensis]AKE52719.1 hypothetical protein TQ33_1778 [Kangiella geojedonensis]
MKKGTGCLTAFGGIFFIAGLGIFIWGLFSSVNVWRAQDWSVVEAKIINLEQVSSTDDGSTTYGVKGSYRYRFNGNDYQSNQVTFYSGTDNIGSYQKQLYRNLQRASSQKKLKAYVNPENPQESVLDRTMRWGMLGFHSIFLLVFGGIGLGIMLWSRWGAKRLAEKEVLQEAHSEEPWLWRKEWQGNDFKCKTKGAFKVMLGFAIIWNLISLPGTIAVLHEGNYLKEPLQLLVFLFPLVGLGLIALVVIYYRREKAFGDSKLVLKQTPLVIGGRNSGTIIINGDLKEREVMLTLSCQKVTRRRSGKETRTTTKLLWQDDQRLTVQQHQSRQFAVDFEVKIPEGWPESSDSDINNRIEWILKVEQKQKGPDLQLLFELPAFVVAHRLEIEPPQEDLFSEQGSDETAPSKGGNWRYLDVIESFSNYGKEYYFRPFRHKALGISTLTFGLVFFSIGLGIFIAETSYLFLIAFGGIGFIVFLIGLNMLLFRSRIAVSSGELICKKGALFNKTYRFNKSDIEKITRASNMSSGDKQYYHIAVNTKDGGKEVIAKYLLNSNDVDDLIDQLHSEMGMTL